MKTALFMAAWVIAYAINPTVIGHKSLLFAAIIVMLAFTDIAGWSTSANK